MLAIYGASYVGFSLIDDWRVGVLERFWVAPISRTAIVLGRSLRDIVIVLSQSLFLIVLSFFAGLEASISGIAISLLLVTLIAATLSSCSYIISLFVKEEGALAASINLFLLPIQLLSGITLPLTLAPYWIQTTARFNPFAHTVDGARALFVGKLSDPAVFTSFGLMCVIAGFTLYILIKTYKNRSV